MTSDIGPISSVEVDILVAIHIPQVGSLAPLNPYRHWSGAGPTGGHATRYGFNCPGVQLGRSLTSCDKLLLLDGDLFVQRGHGD